VVLSVEISSFNPLGVLGKEDPTKGKSDAGMWLWLWLWLWLW
jgi:hypothetical protein